MLNLPVSFSTFLASLTLYHLLEFDSLLGNVLAGFEDCFQDLASTLLGMEVSTSMRGVRTCR